MTHAAVIAWMLLVGTGCAASRNVRLGTGRGPTRVHTLQRDVRPVALDEDAFVSAVAGLARTAPVSSYPMEAARRLLAASLPSRPYAHVRGHLGLVSVQEPGRGHLRLSDAPEAELAAAYGRWCKRKALTGDCLHLLERGPTLDEDGKRTLAFSIALDSVWDETEDALRGMTDRGAVLSMIVTTGALYLGLWLLPEPVSKGVAATMTAVLIAYLGVDTVWSLIQGWMRLADAVADATTFDELRDAGEQYGEVMGQNAARAFVMLATAALGSTAETLAAKVPTLPGSAQASLVAAAEGGFRLGAVAQVESVVVSATGDILLTLAPGVVATGGPVDVPGPKHHIASDKFSTSTANGGPWTPRYQKIFRRAGMSLDDPANQVDVPGHRGPHPREYHERVHGALELATESCETIAQCRESLTRTLRILAEEILQKGSPLNKLVTRTE
ncbi:AHH domain-containing protein [Corallococcus exiguus]|uniref:AHH domain-containing protein n=1 Tax=Corallococcus exiguus TaxID=83462 RepID=UPI0014948447|nr:AHH domain-containing protein [Corallococcus exiguus]NPD22645.1 AHH domain-containing protein [Corallococcus exiguus]